MFLLLKPFSYFSRMKKSLQVLGLQPPTTKKAIKAKYLELVKLSHPDVAESKQL
jgi:DnaJ-domain-containing protein 1